MPKSVKRVLHICIIVTIIIAIAFAALILILQYNENGETNMPFEVSKITVVSTVDAFDVEDSSNRWNVQVIQNNDIYIDIKKNEDYTKKRIIKSVKLSNFKVTKQPMKGNIEIYRPSNSEIKTFENVEEYKVNGIEYAGDKATNIQNLKISNQGRKNCF